MAEGAALIGEEALVDGMPCTVTLFASGRIEWRGKAAGCLSVDSDVLGFVAEGSELRLRAFVRKSGGTCCGDREVVRERKDVVIRPFAPESLKIWCEKLREVIDSLGRPKRLLILVNPYGGKQSASKIFANEVEPLLIAADIKYHLQETQHQLHAKEISYALDLAQFDGIVCVSGDGVLVEVVNGLLQRKDWATAIKMPIGIVPAGSGNGMVKSLLDSVDEACVVSNAIFAVIRGRKCALDVATILQGDKSFFSVLMLTWGIVADIDIESEKYRWMGSARFDFYKGPVSSETVIGQGNTGAWKMCGLDKGTSLCLVFEIARKESPDAIAQPTSNQFYFQFLTYYQHSNGQMRLRATTISRRWVAGPGILQDLIAGFDQETAAVVLARMVSIKMETEAEFDPVRWLDRSLIRLCSKFGDYQKETPSSFSLSPRLSIFPQFIFHLRRSQFVQVFNNSPDETAYFRMILNRENVANSVVMIQPSLISYSFHSAPEPALLDVAAIAADRILLLDSYFTVVVFHGVTIAQWRSAGYQNQPEHEVFAQLLKAPREDADAIIKERFPVPRLVVCDQHGSQARFLLAKLNPSATYNSDSVPAPGGDIIFTDDVSFQIFLDHLQRLAVQ